MERHTPDIRPRSEEERPYPRHLDRGRAKNTENTGDLTRWQAGRSSPANASVDPRRLPVPESIRSPGSGWAWTEYPPRRCSFPVHTRGRDSAHRRILCAMEFNRGERIPPFAQISHRSRVVDEHRNRRVDQQRSKLMKTSLHRQKLPGIDREIRILRRSNA